MRGVENERTLHGRIAARLMRHANASVAPARPSVLSRSSHADGHMPVASEAPEPSEVNWVCRRVPPTNPLRAPP